MPLELKPLKIYPMEKKKIVEMMIRKRGINKSIAQRELKVSRPTFVRLISNLDNMKGHHRRMFAETLGTDVELIDHVINCKKFSNDDIHNLILKIERR
jgi:hypothetical protein